MERHKRYLEQNRAWVAERKSHDPDFFRRMAEGQTPEILWIGCSDSRVSSLEITKSGLGEVFVHRNIANQAKPDDASFLSVIEFSLEVLRIPQIIVCGHYGCGGVEAALSGLTGHCAVDGWLGGVRDLAEKHRAELEELPGSTAQANRLVELNIYEQIDHICNLDVVQQTWKKGQLLCIHGWVYDMPNGLLRDLEMNINGLGDIPKRP